MKSNIFLSYNPNIELEQSTAFRLQTLASLYDTTILLPDRYGTTHLKDTTKERIRMVDWFIVFSTKALSKAVKDELIYALENKKKILVAYSVVLKKNLDIEGVLEHYIDHEKTANENAFEIIQKIQCQSNDQSKDKGSIGVLGAVLGIGLGLLALWKLSGNGKK